MRIVAADSSSAVLNERFKALTLIAAAAVQVRPPYRDANEQIVEPIFLNIADGQQAIVHEAELCRDLVCSMGADVVHLDMSLGAVPIEQLSPIELTSMRLSAKARQHLVKSLPKLRKISNELTQKYGIEMLAIGKDSIPVRIAELTSGAYAILYACEKVVKEKQVMLVGLPSKCQVILTKGLIQLCSLIAAEHDVRGLASDEKCLLDKVNIHDMLNPSARGFRVIKITQKIEEC